MEAPILELEKQYWNGMQQRHYETLQSLTRFPCLIAGKTGVQSVDEPSYKAMFDAGAAVEWEGLEISNPLVQQLNEHTAVIVYLMRFTRSGASGSMASTCACSSTWVQQGGQWLCAMHSESEVEKKQ